MFASKLACAIVFSAAMAFSTSVAASAPMDLGQIRMQQQQIRAEVIAGKGRYKDMPARTRDELLAKQDGLLKMIEGKKTNSELTESQKMEAFNTLEWIEATVNNAEDERVICKSEKPTGSHRPQKVCRTVAQIRQEREASERAVYRRAVCSEGGMCAGK